MSLSLILQWISCGFVIFSCDSSQGSLGNFCRNYFRSLSSISSRDSYFLGFIQRFFSVFVPEFPYRFFLYLLIRAFLHRFLHLYSLLSFVCDLFWYSFRDYSGNSCVDFSRDSVKDFSRHSFRVPPGVSPLIPSMIFFRNFFLDFYKNFFRDSFFVSSREEFLQKFLKKFLLEFCLELREISLGI